MTSLSPKPLYIVETFVGAGGAHLGFNNAGFTSLLVNDNNTDMINTLKMNNIVTDDQCLTCPIENITPLMLETKCKGVDIDVLFGGVVCKGFSLAGVRNPFDERNYLYKHQLRLVDILKPKVSVIENVPGLKSMLLYEKCDETINTFSKYTQLSDANKKLNGAKSSKQKNNETYADLSDEIKNNKATMATMLLNIDKHKYNIMDDIEQMYKQIGYTCHHKILHSDKFGCYTSRKRIIIVAVRNDISKTYNFPQELDTSYSLNDALQLIDYTQNNNPSVDIENRPMNHAVKTVERFKLIPEGSNIADIIDDIPSDLQISKFYSRGSTQRLDRNRPAPTLVPGHSNFPIHPWEHRSITVREAATITGFPNNYKFHGSHTSKCIQIGNAVPIQLAYHIATSIKKILL